MVNEGISCMSLNKCSVFQVNPQTNRVSPCSEKEKNEKFNLVKLYSVESIVEEPSLKLRW